MRSLLALVASLLGVVSTTSAVDFHWGVASSGFQHEGYHPDSNWARYVQNASGLIQDPIKNSVDFYHRYASDIALAKAMGVNTYRFGIEWARIEPKEGVINQTEWAHYDSLVNTVIAAGMTPMITLDHWVYPGWLYDQGGWSVSSTVTKWVNHVTSVVTRYKGKGVLWVTINEAVVYMDNEKKFQNLNSIQVAIRTGRLVDAHRKAYDMIHKVDPGAMVTSNIAYKPPPLHQIDDIQYFDRISDKLDFIGIDYYYSASLGDLSVINAQSGNYWDVTPQPDGLYYAIMEYHKKVPKLPVYIVENGMPTDNAKPRPDNYTRSNHLMDHIYWLQRARNDGVKVMGYNSWSITDNYEWGSYRSRFGLYTVNVLTDPTLTRIPTDAVATYKQIISNGGVPTGYTPVMPPALCALGAGIKACLGQVVSLVSGFDMSDTTDSTPELSPGATGGIVAGVGIGVGFIGATAFVAVRRQRRRRAEQEMVKRNSAVVATEVRAANPTFGLNV